MIWFGWRGGGGGGLGVRHWGGSKGLWYIGLGLGGEGGVILRQLWSESVRAAWVTLQWVRVGRVGGEDFEGGGGGGGGGAVGFLRRGLRLGGGWRGLEGGGG